MLMIMDTLVRTEHLSVCQSPTTEWKEPNPNVSVGITGLRFNCHVDRDGGQVHFDVSREELAQFCRDTLAQLQPQALDPLSRADD